MRFPRVKADGQGFYHCVSRVVEGRFAFQISARAAGESAKLARQTAEESRRQAEESHRQAERINDVMLNTAKANALATRIQYYNAEVEWGRTHGWSTDSATARDQQEHLVCQLDEILDKMEVGPSYPCEGSKHNDKVEGWKNKSR
jgi:hypothetical protein